MGMGMEGEADGEVTRYSADRLVVCVVQECNGCKAVMKTVELYLGIPMLVSYCLTLIIPFKSVF